MTIKNRGFVYFLFLKKKSSIIWRTNSSPEFTDQILKLFRILKKMMNKIWPKPSSGIPISLTTFCLLCFILHFHYLRSDRKLFVTDGCSCCWRHFTAATRVFESPTDTNLNRHDQSSELATLHMEAGYIRPRVAEDLDADLCWWHFFILL